MGEGVADWVCQHLDQSLEVLGDLWTAQSTNFAIAASAARS